MAGRHGGGGRPGMRVRPPTPADRRQAIGVLIGVLVGGVGISADADGR
jgi:hypothetical protein